MSWRGKTSRTCMHALGTARAQRWEGGLRRGAEREKRVGAQLRYVAEHRAGDVAKARRLARPNRVRARHACVRNRPEAAAAKRLEAQARRPRHLGLVGALLAEAAQVVVAVRKEAVGAIGAAARLLPHAAHARLVLLLHLEDLALGHAALLLLELLVAVREAALGAERTRPRRHPLLAQPRLVLAVHVVAAHRRADCGARALRGRRRPAGKLALRLIGELVPAVRERAILAAAAVAEALKEAAEPCE